MMNLELELRDTENIDVDWLILIREARDLGLTIEEIHAFLLKATK